MENKDLNIFQRMMKITEEMTAVTKNMEVKGTDGKVRYTAVGERDILDAVKPLEAKWGIYSYPFARKFEQLAYKDRIAVRCETIYRFVDVDHSDNFIDITSYGDGIDTGDKAPGKAMTYADKYALMKAYKISTGDDPDQEASPEPVITSKQLSYLTSLLKDRPNLTANITKHFKVETIEQLTAEQGKLAIDKAKKTIEKLENEAKKLQKQASETKPVETPIEPKAEEKVEESKTVVEPAKVAEEVNLNEEKSVEVTEKLASPIQKAKINASIDEERKVKMLKAFKVKSLDELTEVQANRILEKLAREKK